MTSTSTPRSTYRLQITSAFTLHDAARLVPYLADLGISHVYLSPILKARQGSTHGYDTVDHRLISPELGGEDAFRHLADRLKHRNMGILLDIVPNHMGVGGDENDLWLDLLEWGEASRYADWFDINWAPSEPSLRGKVLVPFLGRTYADALSHGGLELRYDEASGAFAVWAEGAHKLPLTPRTYPDLLPDLAPADLPDAAALARPGDAATSMKQRLRAMPAGMLSGIAETVNRSPLRLHELIERQNWRPARYSVAADDINYRRFFIVSDLAAIRIERDDVFEHVHQVPLRLVEEGLVDGLRVDHIDGLRDPKAYCLHLRERCSRLIYLVVEKILAPHEQLRRDWQVDGTTGYEFAAAVTQLLTDPESEAALTRLYEELAGSQPDMDTMERDAKLDIIDFEMAAELDGLAKRLHDLSRQSLASADITRHALSLALRAYVAALPVYRTYVDTDPLADTDRRNVAFAIARARQANLALDPAVFDFLKMVLLCRASDAAYDTAEARDVALRIQQYTGPVMAKGLEDTALYRYHRLIALNDVGAKPSRFHRSIAGFHNFCRAQQAHHPHGLLTTSSHDTKRGEDARARIVALTGCVDAWAAHVRGWTDSLAAAGAPEIESNDRYYFFQTLLGAWPTVFAPGATLDPAALETLLDRIDCAMLKSIREARLRTNWTVPVPAYEAAVSRFVRTALEPEGKFLASFRSFEHRIGSLGAENGLIELVLKLTVPGVPDIYQGAEFWEQSLVDPDNRRPVDFDGRGQSLAEGGKVEDLALAWRDGRVKQAVARALLALRNTMPELFSDGDYTALEIEHPKQSVLAFSRQHAGSALLVAVRLHPWRARALEDVVAPLRPMPPRGKWRTVLGQSSIAGSAAHIRFDRLPFAVAVSEEPVHRESTGEHRAA